LHQLGGIKAGKYIQYSFGFDALIWHKIFYCASLPNCAALPDKQNRDKVIMTNRRRSNLCKMSIAVFSICIELLKPTSKNKKQQGRLMTIPGNACKI